MRKAIGIIVILLLFGGSICGIIFGVKYKISIDTMYTQQQVEQIKEDVKNEWADQEKDYVQQIEECLTAMEELQDEIAENVSKLTDLQNQYDVLLGKYNQSESNNEALQDEISDLESQISSLNATISNLNAQILEYESLLEAYEKYEGQLLQIKFYVDTQLFNIELVDIGDSLDLASVVIPQKIGFDFLGWSEDGETLIENTNVECNEDKTYYAIFNPIYTDAEFCNLGLIRMENGVLDLSIYPISTIPEGSFADNDEIIEVKLPETVTTIGNSAFSSCSSLKEINIENVKSFGDASFTSCSSLFFSKPVVFDENVEYIGESAFANSSVRDIAIFGNPNIKRNAFSGTSLISVFLSKNFTMENCDAFVYGYGPFSFFGIPNGSFEDLIFYTDFSSFPETWDSNFFSVSSFLSNDFYTRKYNAFADYLANSSYIEYIKEDFSADSSILSVVRGSELRINSVELEDIVVFEENAVNKVRFIFSAYFSDSNKKSAFSVLTANCSDIDSVNFYEYFKSLSPEIFESWSNFDLSTISAVEFNGAIVDTGSIFVKIRISKSAGSYIGAIQIYESSSGQFSDLEEFTYETRPSREQVISDYFNLDI